jgi:hypothetical protein
MKKIYHCKSKQSLDNITEGVVFGCDFVPVYGIDQVRDCTLENPHSVPVKGE